MKKLETIAKLGIFLSLVALFGIGFGSAFKTIYWENSQPVIGKIYYQTPLGVKEWEDIGLVSNPVISLPVKVKSGYKEVNFLLDSGAVISTLPPEMAEKMDLDLAFLQRIPFISFNGEESIGYKAIMTVLINDVEVVIPVIFTQKSNTTPLLGRQGFFDEFIITFNKSKGIVEIRK